MIGEFNRRIKVKINSVAINEAGGADNDVETVLFETWAKVEPISNKALLLQGQDMMNNTYRMTIRYAPPHIVTTNNIIEYEGKNLIISSGTQEVKEGSKRFIQFMASEKSING